MLLDTGADCCWSRCWLAVIAISTLIGTLVLTIDTLAVLVGTGITSRKALAILFETTAAFALAAAPGNGG